MSISLMQYAQVPQSVITHVSCEIQPNRMQNNHLMQLHPPFWPINAVNYSHEKYTIRSLATQFWGLDLTESNDTITGWILHRGYNNANLNVKAMQNTLEKRDDSTWPKMHTTHNKKAEHHRLPDPAQSVALQETPVKITHKSVRIYVEHETTLRKTI